MKHMQRVAAMVLGSLVLATSAMAFPGWIGVYGSIQRYNTNANPGTYTILMNQSYVGLHAEVGVQVNGGTWTLYPMSWAGLQDNNSKWTFTPAAAYQAGAVVKYYFHGWDDWGGHIYDSQNGANYSFTIPSGNNTGLSWSAAAQIPTQPGTVGADIAAYNGSLYAVWGTRSNEYNSALTVWLSKKLPNAAWQAPQLVTTVAGAFQTPRIAAAANGVHILVNDYTGLFYFRSSNEGASWDSFGGQPFLVISNANYAELRADADNAYVIFNRYSAPDTSRMFFTKKANNSNTFTEPQLIFTNSSYKATVYVKDFDISGPRLVLLTYLQGWYGGFVTYYLHQSADGGQTWAGGTQPGQGAHAALRPATGSISYITPDSGVGGAGLYFQSKPFDWINSWKQGYANVWAGEGTADGLRWIDNKLIAVSQRNGLRYFSVGSVDMTEVVTWGSPVLVDSDNYWAVKDLSDGVNMHLLVTQYGSNNYFYTESTRSGAVIPVQWVGNTYHWPGNAELKSWNDLWVNTETFPKGASTNVQVVYTLNGINWTARNLEYAGGNAANDMWHLNLGQFAAGSTVRYAVVAADLAGVEKWDNNGGQDFKAIVSSSSTVAAPIFWGLDPYRFDNEKVRVNGIAGDANKSFGEFATGQVIAVVTRPVENGNGNSVQTACTITSVLHYTTGSATNWGNAVAVTGVFHSAGFSNKPIFDYYSYAIGTLPPGTKVWFWLEARNVAGVAYAQTADQNFSFTIAGSTNGDSDNDGLPDQWEMDWFGNLNQNADGNDDGDGPIGRPLANIIEWLIGTQPNIPNDPMGIRLMWAPAYPAPGETLTLSYFYVNQGNPLFGKPVYAHVGFNGWQGVYDTQSLQPNGAINRFEIQIQVPTNATELNVVFHDNAGTWDNNSGKDWRIAVRPAVAPPAAPSSASSSTTTSTAASPDIKVTLKLTGLDKGVATHALIGYDGWKKVALQPLTAARDGSLTSTYTLPSGNHKLSVALRAKNGSIYGNKGQPWNFIVAGNSDQTVVLDLNKK